MIRTIRWLESYELIDKIELAFAHNKQGYEADVIIDDKPTLAWAQKGKTNLLFTQPWNVDIVPNLQNGITRVDSWDQIMDATFDISNIDLMQGAGGG